MQTILFVLTITLTVDGPIENPAPEPGITVPVVVTQPLPARSLLRSSICGNGNPRQHDLGD